MPVYLFMTYARVGLAVHIGFEDRRREIPDRMIQDADNRNETVYIIIPDSAEAVAKGS
jgi:hypothetical protein